MFHIFESPAQIQVKLEDTSTTDFKFANTREVLAMNMDNPKTGLGSPLLRAFFSL